MDTMNRQQLSQLRGQAAQLIRKYWIPLLVFLLGVALVLIPSRTKKEEPQQTSAEAAETDFNLSATQKQLETLLSAIDGAGRVRLMLTLSSGERIVYQTDSRTVTTSGSTTQETQTVFRQPGGAERSRRCNQSSIRSTKVRLLSATAQSVQASGLQSYRLYRVSQGSEAIKSQL